MGARNVAASGFAAKGRRTWRAAWRPNIRDDTPDGAASRANLVRVAEEEQKKSNRMIGAELGYRYEDSPIIADEDGGPPHEVMNYVPTTWPGTRLPHVWLDDGRALHDLIGSGYTLLRLAVMPMQSRWRGLSLDTARHLPCWTFPRNAFATFTAMISCCCGPICTSYGAAMPSRCLNASLRWRPDTSSANRDRRAALSSSKPEDRHAGNAREQRRRDPDHHREAAARQVRTRCSR